MSVFLWHRFKFKVEQNLIGVDFGHNNNCKFCSQEEQKWLDALEKGELDDFGRVKQDKDVSMMTARQVLFFKILNHSSFSNIYFLLNNHKTRWR